MRLQYPRHRFYIDFPVISLKVVSPRDGLPGQQYFFAQGAMSFDVPGTKPGTTLWHLVREAASMWE
ncbi:hypothetical protein [Photorhabdus caribbeanensis]|uniref:hypothetical protein n=1 Tax=Photorhabdus caribbeanensis TaxID=1004165 RepID=UPI001BD39357|nr:hypothetical protein [Photorhabdus caribbeanensis]